MLIGIDANEANVTRERVGINQYAFQLLHAMYKIKTNDHFVIYLKNPPAVDLPVPKDNWEYRIIPSPMLWTQIRLPFDLLFHSPKPDVFFSMTHYRPRFTSIPTIISIMDLGFLKAPEQFTKKDFSQLKNWTGYSIKKANKIIAISTSTKKDIKHHFHKNSNSISVTLLGYDADKYKKTLNREMLKKYNIAKEYFLFVGSLKPSKNIVKIVEAFKEMPDKYQLVIVGKKAWQYEEIFAKVQELDLQGRVIFTGFVDSADLPILMSHSVAFLMPSLYEGFGIPALEAMACGTPVVVSAVASIPEVVGDAGIYVDPKSGDSILSGMYTAINKKEKFVPIGLKRVKSFSWDKCASETLSIIKSLSNS